jgi:hypothetical protein
MNQGYGHAFFIAKVLRRNNWWFCKKGWECSTCRDIWMSLNGEPPK